MCSLLLYVKRIIMFNERYGRFAFILGIIFIIANIVAGSLNFYLGSGGCEKIDSIKEKSILIWSLIFVPYYVITEFTPAIVYALAMY